MKNLNVRLSDELHAWMKKAAEADIRSLNGEIITMLEHARTCPEAPTVYRRRSGDYTDREIDLARLGHDPGCAFREGGRGVTCTCQD